MVNESELEPKQLPLAETPINTLLQEYSELFDESEFVLIEDLHKELISVNNKLSKLQSKYEKLLKEFPLDALTFKDKDTFDGYDVGDIFDILKGHLYD